MPQLVVVRWRRYWGSIKPAWMRGELFPLILIQAMLSVLVLYVAIGYALGFVQPTTIPDDRLIAQTVFLVSVSLASIVAIVGLYRDRWWAYYLELALVWAIVIAIVFFPIPDAEPNRPKTWGLPFADHVKSVIGLASFIGMNWLFLKRGREKHWEQVVRPTNAQ